MNHDLEECRAYRQETTSRIEELSARFDELQDVVEMLLASMTGSVLEPVERIDVRGPEAD